MDHDGPAQDAPHDGRWDPVLVASHQSSQDADEPRPAEVPRRLGRRWTYAFLGFYVLLFVVRGLPSDPETVVGFVVVALLFDSLAVGGLDATKVVVRDWWPVLGVLVFYSLTRGVADTLGMPVQYELLIDADKLLAGGSVPTVWLQERLLQTEAQWWEAITALVYVSHFIASFVLAGVLYARHRTAWRSFINRFLTLNLAGMVTYVLLPAAPPWLASDERLIGHVDRTVTRGLDLIGLHAAGGVLALGQKTVNEVAALPSLHAGYAFLASFTLWRLSRRWRPLIAAYPLAMGFTLVYSGEHYVVDILLGAVYAYSVLRVWDVIERRRCLDVSPPGPAGRIFEEPGAAIG